MHMRKKQIQLKEMELHALAGMDRDNAKQLGSLLDSYRKMLFPGAESDEEQEDAMEKAKSALAAEANKVLVVRQYVSGEQPLKADPRLAQLGARHAGDLERERMKQMRQVRSRTKKKE